MSSDERDRRDRRRRLELDRARVSAELAQAQRPEHRAMLERALGAIDEQLKT